MLPKHSGVFVIVVNKNSQILLGKRKDSYKAGMYGFPGGRLELNETLIECGKREVLEETGLQTKSLRYVGVVRELQKGYNFIHFAFFCDEYIGEPQLREPNKCESWNFYPQVYLPNNILAGHKAGLDILLKKDGETYRDILK